MEGVFEGVRVLGNLKQNKVEKGGALAQGVGSQAASLDSEGSVLKKRKSVSGRMKLDLMGKGRRWWCMKTNTM